MPLPNKQIERRLEQVIQPILELDDILRWFEPMPGLRTPIDAFAGLSPGFNFFSRLIVQGLEIQ